MVIREGMPKIKTVGMGIFFVNDKIRDMTLRRSG